MGKLYPQRYKIWHGETAKGTGEKNGQRHGVKDKCAFELPFADLSPVYRNTNAILLNALDVARRDHLARSTRADRQRARTSVTEQIIYEYYIYGCVEQGCRKLRFRAERAREVIQSARYTEDRRSSKRKLVAGNLVTLALGTIECVWGARAVDQLLRTIYNVGYKRTRNVRVKYNSIEYNSHLFIHDKRPRACACVYTNFNYIMGDASYRK